MKHIQPKTMRVLYAILASRRFSQRGLWARCSKDSGISLGLVNRVVSDMVRVGFIERAWEGDYVLAGGQRPELEVEGRVTYTLVDPVGILRFIAMFRPMSEMKVFTRAIDTPEKLVLKKLGGMGAVFCLGTAQGFYSSYYRPDEISFYSPDPEKILGYVGTARRGYTKVGCYMSDTGFVLNPKNRQVTSKVQTVIDMFCDGKGAYTKPLLRELWEVEI